MTNYAVLENNKVENIIVADSLEIAEEATGRTCIEILDGMENAHLNSTWDGDKFISSLTLREEA